MWEKDIFFLSEQPGGKLRKINFCEFRTRPERWIVTIPSSDQWLATIGNHWKTIVSNGWRTIKPLKNHCYQWFLDPKTIGKPLLPMVLVTKNH